MSDAESTVEKITEEVKKVPKKYWVIGGVALLLLFLFLRKRSIVAAQNQQTSDTLDMATAMQIPGGLSFAPITSGVSGGGGNQGDNLDYLLTDTDTAATTSNAPTTATPSTGTTYTPTTAATIPGSSATNYTGGMTGDHTGILVNGDPANELKMGDVLNFFKQNKVTNTTELAQLYNFGHAQGLSNLGISQARHYAKTYLGIDTYSFAEDMGDPNGTKFDALVASSGTGNLKLPTATTTQTAAPMVAPVAAVASPTVAAPVSAPAISNGEIFSFYSAHRDDPRALNAARTQYHITDAQLADAGVPQSAFWSDGA